MCLNALSHCFVLLSIIALPNRTSGQAENLQSKDQSPSEAHITQLDWDKFDFMYTLDDHAFHSYCQSHQCTPQHTPRHYYQSPQQLLPSSNKQSSRLPSPSPSVQLPMTKDEESRKSLRSRKTKNERERLSRFKTSDPKGYKEYNRQRYLARKSRRNEIRASYNEEKKKENKARMTAYQSSYRQRLKAKTGYTKMFDKKYQSLKNLVQQNRATPEQVNQFENSKREATLYSKKIPIASKADSAS